jgi:hypothetical protein
VSLRQEYRNICIACYNESGPGRTSCKTVIDGNPQLDYQALTVYGGPLTRLQIEIPAQDNMYKARGLSMYVYRLSEHHDINIVHVRCLRRYPTFGQTMTMQSFRTSHGLLSRKLSLVEGLFLPVTFPYCRHPEVCAARPARGVRRPIVHSYYAVSYKCLAFLYAGHISCRICL